MYEMFIGLTGVALWFFITTSLVKKRTILTRSLFKQQKQFLVYQMIILLMLGLIIGLSLPISMLFAFGLSLLISNGSLQFVLHERSCLVVIPDLRGACVYVHLSDPASSFCREHYKELKKLLETFEAIGVKRVKLTSPMFFKNNSLRKFSMLEKVIQPDWQMTHHRSYWWKHLLSVLSLVIHNAKDSNSASRTLPIFQWQQVILNRRAS